MMAPGGGGSIGPAAFAVGGAGIGGGGAGGGAIGGGEAAVLAAAGPIFPGTVFGRGSESILSPGAFIAGQPVGPESIFNIGGAPIAILGGVFTDGLPIGGPVGQIFRSSAPQPNTLYIATISPSGPIGVFIVGAAGAPIFPPSPAILALQEAVDPGHFIIQTTLERSSELASF